MSFNIASYALLTMMVAQVPRPGAGSSCTPWATRLYMNHLEQADPQLSRTPRELPRMVPNPERRQIDDFLVSDFRWSGTTR